MLIYCAIKLFYVDDISVWAYMVALKFDTIFVCLIT